MTIDQLKELESKATPGPWHLSKDGNIVQTKHVTRDVWVIPHSDGDMALIAAMRNAMPALLEVARAAKHAAEYFGSKDLCKALAKLEELR